MSELQAAVSEVTPFEAKAVSRNVCTSTRAAFDLKDANAGLDGTGGVHKQDLKGSLVALELVQEGLGTDGMTKNELSTNHGTIAKPCTKAVYKGDFDGTGEISEQDLKVSPMVMKPLKEGLATGCSGGVNTAEFWNEMDNERMDAMRQGRVPRFSAVQASEGRLLAMRLAWTP